MRTVLRLSPVPVFALALLLGGCGQAGAGGGEWPADRTFRSTGVTENGKPRPLNGDSRIELTFHGDGRLSARADCNILGGTAEITDGKLVVAELGGTDMGCDPARHAQDEWLGGFLGAGPAFALSGDTMTLTSGATVISLIDKKVENPDKPLLGTTWTVDTLIAKDTASSLPAGTPPATVEFAADGSTTATIGCVIAVRTAKVAGNTITFSDNPAFVGDVCTVPGVVSEAVRKVLAGSAEYKIDSERLTITAGDGTGLGLTTKP